MSDKQGESFIRWQGIRIQQLTFVNNLLIGLATGILAFQTQLAFNNQVSLNQPHKWGIILSMLLIFSSLSVGCYLAWNRLISFRITAQVALRREEDEDDIIQRLRDETSERDKLTWALLEVQITLFALGAFLMLLVAIAAYLR